MSTAPPLRFLSADAAVRLAMRETKRLGLRQVSHLAGSQVYPITVLQLMQDQIGVATGVGKGAGSERLAGAHFEALECYYMSARINRRLTADPATLITAKEVARQPSLAVDLVIQRWAEDFPNSVAACAAYSNANSSVWYPIFLVDPHYHLAPLPGDSVEPYRSMLRYTSSLGTAAGATASEARLHALCELIEHDALSHSLLRWFVARIPQVDVVDISSLPPEVRSHYDIAVAAIDAEVILFDLTSDFGVPAYLAVKDSPGAETVPSGSGASPIGEQAALRALGELIHATVLSDEIGDHTAKGRLAAWPVLQECFTGPSRLLSYRGVRHVPLRGNLDHASTVETALDTVTRLLGQHDIYSYTCELAPPESFISVVSAIAPGLERFSLVRMGMPVIPTGRGWSIWARAHGCQ